ncbi:DUF2612 domain-containing protein [Rhizobium leguminosarum]|uniref:DUF2612 domain-containing protein n=1 Tax=Rhizobium leguminosarum TaxID=384 RepID=A0A444I370_RHILE|nr:DUF2612 domain-containing protein [Rhizobium leguminosarum]RWX32052.1 DUF2612 domain-containing protein [Rhizobium leguminosarum]
MACIEETAFIEAGIDRVLTQYRESPKLLHVIRSYLQQLWIAQNAICDLPSYFDLDTAVGDQLTIIGKWMGFPRCHCVCDVQPVFGFACDTPTVGGRTVTGFCEGGIWLACNDDGISEICITDDEVYRKLLIARSYQMQSLYGWDDLLTALQAIFGTQARIMDAGHGQVVLAPLRALSDLETAILQVIPRVLPIAPGITTRWHFGTFKVFGFGEGWGGFCEEWEPGGLPIVTGNGTPLVTEDETEIWTGPLTRDADWLCRFDVKPYSC